jgi:hypothetical protein
MFGAGFQIFFYLLVPWTALVFFLAFRSGKGSLGHALGRAVLGLMALALTVPTVIAFAFGVGAYGKGHGLGLFIAGGALLVGLVTTLVYGREELRVIDLVTFQVAPYAEGGGGALVASPRHARTVVARGRDLYMIGPPVESGGGARTWRLRPWFF